MTLDAVVQQYAGTILTVGGSVTVALIGAYAMIRARKASPGREPVPIQDIWEENRLVTKDYRDLRREHGELEEKFTALSSEVREYKAAKDAEVKITRHAVEILWNYVERIKLAWGSDRMPSLSHEERSVLNQVIEDVTTPPAGIPLIN
jgi:hypothetical protein